jgi:hypothetical protein
MNSEATTRALALIAIFIPLISLSISSINCSEEGQDVRENRVDDADLNDEINKLMFPHSFQVNVSDEETDIISLFTGGKIG